MDGDHAPRVSGLLPVARIGVYARDRGTVAAFETLRDDWRFARVSVQVHEGDVATALRLYQSGQPSEDLIVIETDTIDGGFTASLETLSVYCREDTAAIVIGPVNDVSLYRRLVGMGISDYLVRPVDAAALREDVAATLAHRKGMADSRLITLVGAKGGVGTSALAQGLAAGLADSARQKTMLFDVAGGWSNTGVGFGFEPSATINEAVRVAMSGDQDGFRRMVFHAGDRLDVLATGSDPLLESGMSPDVFETLLDFIMAAWPVVVLDLSGSPADVRRIALARSHEIMIVSTPTLSSLRLARGLMQDLKSLRNDGDDAVDLIVNMQGMAPGLEVGRADIARAMGHEPSATIAFDPRLFAAAENQGKKLLEDKAGAKAIGLLLPLAYKVVPGDRAATDGQNKGGGLGKLMMRFKGKS